jgi:Cu(I)/Ag(I) efflux system membrane fusion protein
VAEYRALQANAQHAPDLVSAARERLRILGIPDGEVAALMKEKKGGTAIPLRSPIKGVITEIGVREGMAITVGQTLFRINGIDPLWIAARLPEKDADGISQRAAVEVQVPALPGSIFAGTVREILPSLDAESRTLTARIALPNPDGALKPGMFATVRLREEAPGLHLFVPSQAVIRTGLRIVVMVQEADSHFRAVAVTPGVEADERTEIRRGLTGDERIVVSGQFLVDSEAKLKSALDRIAPPSAMNGANVGGAGARPPTADEEPSTSGEAASAAATTDSPEGNASLEEGTAPTPSAMDGANVGGAGASPPTAPAAAHAHRHGDGDKGGSP